MLTYGDFFTGFGGMTIGAQTAGLDVRFGVEWDEHLAGVYAENIGDHVVVADVTKLDMHELPGVDVFHASPPCTNASVANASAGESPMDMAMATAVCDYLRVHLPVVFTMENVYQYRNFESWYMIARTLLELGYSYAFWHVNMADYGVPQTRKRMIVVARQDGKRPSLPEPTHEQFPVQGLFGKKPKWVSWYEAIEDLIPSLPDSQFADWQLKRMPEELLETVLFSSNDLAVGIRDVRGRGIDEPSGTVMASDYRRPSTVPRAFVVSGGNTSSATTRLDDEPCFTVGDVGRVGNLPRAFIVSARRNSVVKQRAYHNGRVVRITPEAVARFQSFPKWYRLPSKDGLAVKGLGRLRKTPMSL